MVGTGIRPPRPAADAERRWSIVQKQTGADRLSIGGALAANGHGRGLTYRPIVQDVDAFELIDADGNLIRCDRNEHADRFRLAIGGYGLFGVIATVDLRLMPAHSVRAGWWKSPRSTDWKPGSKSASRTASPTAIFNTAPTRIRPASSETAYCPATNRLTRKTPATAAPPQHMLTDAAWRQLLYWSHADKARAFDEYAGFYRSTDGQVYDSDTFQLSQYIDHYHHELDQRLGRSVPGSETITELYVPLAELEGFMAAAGAELRRQEANVIYGTIRLSRA